MAHRPALTHPLRRLPAFFLLLAGACLPYAPPARAQDVVRVASYNIRTFDAAVQTEGDRLDKLRQVVDLLDADVIGLEVIADRTSLRLLFPADTWSLLIDDDSHAEFDIDLALAVRKPYRLLGFGGDAGAVDFDADDANFLFPGAANNALFPGRRDVLFAEIGPPGDAAPFVVMVHHAKSRRGGRANTDGTREGAARRMVEVLRQDFSDTPFILLGDFNDNPDDRSLNILETGDPDAPGGPEEIPGPFLVNLMEPLVVENRVSHGRKSNDIVGDRINTVDPQSRARNNDARGTNANTGDILFDQILIPAWTADRYVAGSAQVFDFAVAAQGNETTRASDHLPVFAEFELVPLQEEPPPALAGTRIVSLLPNPDGDDRGREEVTVANFTGADLDLSGWKLRDASGNEFVLSGVVPPAARLTFVMVTNTMPLNNTGDTVSLLGPDGAVVHAVTYTSAQASSGVTVLFP